MRARLTHTSTTTYININMKRPQHITITSIKYLISYPINMKVSNQVFTTSNSNKCVGGLCLCLLSVSVCNVCKKEASFLHTLHTLTLNKHKHRPPTHLLLLLVVNT